LHVIALHVIALHVIALHVIALHVIALHVIALHVIALHWVSSFDELSGSTGLAQYLCKILKASVTGCQNSS
jgi:hypothetical protein